MTLKRKWIVGCSSAILLALLAIVGLHRLGGPFYYYADDIRARVIDEQTGKPVEGVVVVAMWNLETIGSHPTGTLHADETLTDRNGMFLIPGFGPALRPPLSWLTYQDPWLIFYKRGYYDTRRSNNEAYIPVYTRAGSRVKSRKLPDGRILQVGGSYSRDARRFCYWNGKTIGFDRRAETPEEQARAGQDFETALPLESEFNPLRLSDLPLAADAIRSSGRARLRQPSSSDE